ncbi:hypothetical protein HY635_02515, partial [Candidatus Uhrbacteria bacterium]|nr:hypothetical protein [Candidatus Uhrbacteria bacterium]
GLAATTAHGEGYAREGDRSYYRAVSPRIAALERARAIAVEYGALTPGGKPPICKGDPDLPACRE